MGLAGQIIWEQTTAGQEDLSKITVLFYFTTSVQKVTITEGRWSVIYKRKTV